MAWFFSKALTLEPSEEKLVLLWTVLEIFPMKDTTDIRPISEYLSPIVGQPPDVVKETLSIGRLCGIRSELVHHGILPIAKDDMGELFGQLENICVEVMRALSNLPYRGTLTSYF